MENPGVRNLSSHIVLIKQRVPWEKTSLASHTLRAIRVLLWDKRMPCFSYRRKTVPFQLKSKKHPSMLFSYAILFWCMIKYLQTIYLSRQYTFLPLVFKVFLKKVISSFKYLHIYISNLRFAAADKNDNTFTNMSLKRKKAELLHHITILFIAWHFLDFQVIIISLLANAFIHCHLVWKPLLPLLLMFYPHPCNHTVVIGVMFI